MINEIKPFSTLVVDDPPLRMRHGRLDLAKLDIGLQSIGAKASIATIPTDAHLGSSEARKYFTDNDETAIGWCVHGLDHMRGECSRKRISECQTTVNKIIRSVEYWSELNGVRLERAMVFPHGSYSNEFLKTMNPSGEGFQMALATTAKETLEKVDGCYLISRIPIEADLDEYRSSIDKGIPIVITSHHWDFKDGVEPVIAKLEAIASLNGAPDWQSLGHYCGYDWGEPVGHIYDSPLKAKARRWATRMRDNYVSAIPGYYGAERMLRRVLS